MMMYTPGAIAPRELAKPKIGEYMPCACCDSLCTRIERSACEREPLGTRVRSNRPFMIWCATLADESLTTSSEAESS